MTKDLFQVRAVDGFDDHPLESPIPIAPVTVIAATTARNTADMLSSSEVAPVQSPKCDQDRNPDKGPDRHKCAVAES